MVYTSSAESGDSAVPDAISQQRNQQSQPQANRTTSDAWPYWESTADGRRCQWRFHTDLRSVVSMRWELRVLLGGTGLPFDELEDLLRAVSEAANNAVEHPHLPREPFFDVSTKIDDGSVTIVVQDHGQWRQPKSSSDRGPGLAMMRALADATVTSDARGTTVTLRKHRTGTEPLDAEPLHEERRAS
ncbi:Anti-sigma regulatory factor (Ser/Thr protein kinase) [Geodermatophilus africanus]|uniref:Anti-sigma regulatory factor (Ser/Thr protein kinase) n=1 Tax=Geodermatophilus africanus TaxID=1137993 RepID=A0A1H3NMJ3_9ACTN|nr:ATP-binding protein [Geodermatophilus africanus]SDY89429.1 Anti-sigma regulatory factor (Ser/Thr protein kinase) [Geodermatophilus africanus]